MTIQQAETTVDTKESKIPCSTSPGAPQVEEYALDELSIPSNLEQEPLSPEELIKPTSQVAPPPTRSMMRVECITTPSPLEISESTEKHGQGGALNFVKTSFGASKSVVASKLRVPLAPRNIDNHASDRVTRYTRSSSAKTQTARQEKTGTTSINHSHIELPTTRIGTVNEDNDEYSGRELPDLVSTSSDDDVM